MTQKNHLKCHSCVESDGKNVKTKPLLTSGYTSVNNNFVWHLQPLSMVTSTRSSLGRDLSILFSSNGFEEP